MWKYNSSLDEYTEVDFDSDSDISLPTKRSEIELSPINKEARIINKNGKINTLRTLRHKIKWYSNLKDLGYTLLATRWRWIWVTVFVVNFVCFLFFGLVWMWLAHISGDFDLDQKNNSPCVVNTKSFTGYLLLSIETITTIGYGSRYPSENCKFGWIVLTFQALCSVALQGALVSAIYVKTSLPFIRVLNSLFSKKAVICLRDGQFCFIFRIHDFNSKIWCGTSISLYFVDKSVEVYEFKEMKVKSYGLLIFPLEIEHVIDEDSPLWDMDPEDLAKNNYEIVAVAEGSSIITGQMSQNRTSFIFSDINWGHRFVPCVTFNEKLNGYEVDYKLFKKTIPFDTPLCSAKELREYETFLAIKQ